MLLTMLFIMRTLYTGSCKGKPSGTGVLVQVYNLNY